MIKLINTCISIHIYTFTIPSIHTLHYKLIYLNIIMAKNFDNCSNENNENKKLKSNDQDFEQLDEFNQSKKLEKGKWYTHLSLPVEFNEKNTDLIQSVIENMEKEFQNKATLLDEFHISVSRLLIIKNSLYKPICDSITNIFKLQST